MENFESRTALYHDEAMARRRGEARANRHRGVPLTRLVN